MAGQPTAQPTGRDETCCPVSHEWRLEGVEKANGAAGTDLSVRFDKMDLLKVLNKAEDFWARTSSGLQRKLVVGLGVVSWTW